MKHVIKRLCVKRNFEVYPDTDSGHRDFWQHVELIAEEAKVHIEQRDCIVCEWGDFPIFELHTVIEWVIEIEEMPNKKEISFGTLLFYRDCVKLDNFGTIQDCEIKEVEDFLEQDIIETKVWLEHLKTLK